MGSKSRYFLICVLKIMPLLTLCVCSAGSVQGVKKVVISLVVDTSIRNTFFFYVAPTSLLEAYCREFTYLPMQASQI